MPTHRSIAELLPVPFDQVREDHVRSLLGEGRPGDEESIVFEVKETVTKDSLARACAAFANSLGGLLVVGVTKTGEFVGFDCPGAEAELWVKDVLRSRVIPMPPFRARFVPLSAEIDAGKASDGGEQARQLLLVLVEYSSTTPHIVARHGVILVRQPGASEPLDDQATLLDLARRGEQARQLAVALARRRTAEPWPNSDHGHTLVLVPTGVPAEWVDEALTPAAVSSLYQLVRSAVWTEAQDRHPPNWAANRVSVQVSSRGLRGGVITGSAALGADGSLILQRTSEGVPLRGSLMLTNLLQDLESMYVAGRAYISGLGAHGDVRLSFSADYVDQEVTLTSRGYFKDRDAPDRGQHMRAERPLRVTVEEWGYLAQTRDLLPEDDRPLIRMGAAIERSLGAQPG